MITVTDVVAIESAHLLPVYKRNRVVFDRGHGCRLYDPNGRSYLDFISGVGVASLGHTHARLSEAIAAQSRDLLHTSNLFYHPLQGELATRLSSLTGMPRAFFCNSGTEAVEACLKFARKYWYSLGTPRPKFVAFEHGFHGRTMGSVSVTWDEHYRKPFEPLVPDVHWVPTDDPAALQAAVDGTTAAIIVEPLQGEGGVRPLSRVMAHAINDAARRTGALVIADEVQSGCGRTGVPFYSSAIGLAPDLMALGKALGAGVPIGAALFTERVAAAAAPGDHGSTYGGNLLACRAALVFLDELIDRNLIAQVGRVGAHLEKKLRAMGARQAIVRDVRGAGLMWGIELDRSAAPVVETALHLGLLINRTADTVVRLLPPYVLTTSEVDEAMVLLEQAISAVGELEA